MPISVVRLGTPRVAGEQLRLGTVRRPPRGVPKAEFAARNFYDVWLPEVAPSSELVSWALSEPWTDARWRTYTRRYLAEMRRPAAQRTLALLAALSRHMHVAVGCYCEDESRCHRRLLRGLLAEHGATFVSGPGSIMPR